MGNEPRLWYGPRIWYGARIWLGVLLAIGVYKHAVTGNADGAYSEKVKQSGIKLFILKPCQKQDLANTIRLILDKK
jgi:hypothetical protein